MEIKGKELITQIETSHTESGQLVGWFLGQEGYVLKYNEQVFLIDPVLNDIKGEDGSSAKMYDVPFAPEQLQADYVLCTHGHIDHMAKETLKGLLKKNPNLIIGIPIGCKSLAHQYGIMDKNLMCFTPGQTYELTEGVTIHAISAAHPTHIVDETDENMALSYEISFGTFKVVHLGDTYLTESLYQELDQIREMDVLMMPINGDDYFRKRENIIGNIEAEEAAKLASALDAKLSIPMHFDMMKGNLADPARFANKINEIDATKKYLIPELGDEIIFVKK